MIVETGSILSLQIISFNLKLQIFEKTNSIETAMYVGTEASAGVGEWRQEELQVEKANKYTNIQFENSNGGYFD